ncbi:SgrR family transcriptional regulator [Parasalinivibrio latis]|uniref:SgrR family transcriptional regulator n=1 Tax=Parasalinivibrio latis TaxID=2952610 RepID=UPI0030E53DA7
MSGKRLQSQFGKLYQQFEGKRAETTLQEISDVLCCTRRNARMVLGKMEEQGWLTWTPSIGRGKLSLLAFTRSESQLRNDRVRELILDGKLEDALTSLNNDVSQLARLVEELLGATTLDGKQVIRLPYYRSFPTLNPTKPLRRSECHLVRQIFNGLVKLNEMTEELEGDLAHSWEMISPQRWRFYLRPAVRFHDGKLLDSSDVIYTFEGLRRGSLLRHIDRIICVAPNTIDFELNTDDFHFPVLLTSVQALIIPHTSAGSSTFSQYPVGTGPYKVSHNDEQKLILEANDTYFGYRALTDRVEIWALADEKMRHVRANPALMLEPQNAATVKQDSTQPRTQRMTMDEGCAFLLVNKQWGIGKDKRWSDYFRSRLSSSAVVREAMIKGTGQYRIANAYGLLPGWMHSGECEEVESPAPTYVTMAVQSDNPFHRVIADAVVQLLKNDAVEVELVELDYPDFMTGKHEKKIDFWLSGMSLGYKRSESLLAWLYDQGFVERALTTPESQTLSKRIEWWRGKADIEFPAMEIGAELVEQGCLIPLCHTWLGLIPDSHLQNLSVNGVGWFDFQNVWYKPNIPKPPQESASSAK